MHDNPYKPPEAPVATAAASPGDKLHVKFGVAFAWCWGLLLLMVAAVSPLQSWFFGALGAAIVSLVGGLVGLLVPTRRRLVYVPVAMVCVFAVMILIGLSKHAS